MVSDHNNNKLNNIIKTIKSSRKVRKWRTHDAYPLGLLHAVENSLQCGRPALHASLNLKNDLPIAIDVAIHVGLSNKTGRLAASIVKRKETNQFEEKETKKEIHTQIVGAPHVNAESDRWPAQSCSSSRYCPSCRGL